MLPSITPFTNDIWEEEEEKQGVNSKNAPICLYSLANRVQRIAFGYRLIADQAFYNEDGKQLALAATRAEQILENAGQLIHEASQLVGRGSAFRKGDIESRINTSRIVIERQKGKEDEW